MGIDEVVIKIISKVTTEYEEVDANKLRCILEKILSDYEIKPMTKELTTTATDMQDKIYLYVASKKIDGVKVSTLKNYVLHLKRFAKFINKNVKDIETMDIRRYLAYLMQQLHLKDTTLETEKSILKSFFSWLTDEEYIAKSPAKKIKATKINRRLRNALDDEKLERLRDACKTPRQRALVEFFFSTGCRLSEVVSLNISDLNWNECTFRVTGKGNKERNAGFSKKARLYLKKYLASRADMSCQALFVSEKKPYGRLKNRAIEKEFHKIQAQAHMDESIYPHLMRHTMATMGLKSGMRIETIQKLLGHSNISTTEIYAEVADETVKEEYRKYLVQ